jgi:hypothetical protein
MFVIALAVTPLDAAKATVFERDWKTPGDGLLTYDDVSQREWLDLSVSRLDQFPEPRLEHAIAEIATGGLFEGFIWAKYDDVRNFATSAGINIATTDLAINGIPTNEVIDLLGPTFDSAVSRRSVGLINEMQSVHPNAPPYDGAAFRIQAFAGLYFNISDDLLRQTSNGLMLYRVVPEPSSLLLVSLAVCAFIASRNAIRFAMRS